MKAFLCAFAIPPAWGALKHSPARSVNVQTTARRIRTTLVAMRHPEPNTV
jgi:hypothetical protein